jgi:hypothetical protein
MNSLQTKVASKLAKHYASQNDEVSNIRAAITALDASLKANKDKLSKMESQYSHVASDRLSKRLKEGVDIRKAETNQRQLTTAEAKKDRLEEEFDAKIEALKEKKERMIAEFDGKIEVLKAKKRTELEAVDSTISYFKPIVNKYYEAVPEVIVSYPPSYYGIKEEIETAERQLSMWKNTLVTVLEQQVSAVESPEEKQLKARREQARREDHALAVEAAARQKEEEGRINLERKAAYRAEEERNREKQKSATNTLVTPREDPKKMAIRLAEMKASEELRAENGEVEVKEDESDREEEEKDEDLLADYAWAKEKGLPVLQSTLQKLRDRKLI